MVSLRDAREEDIPAVTAIFNEVMRNSLSLYQEHEVTVQSRLDYYRDRKANGFPFIVAVETNSENGQEEVVGYATYGPFRTTYGYRFTVEHSVYVRQDQRGKRIGHQLLSRIIELAEQSRKVHIMMGVIDSLNEISIRMHEKYGFIEVGRMPEVGFKKGQWLTAVFMQKTFPDVDTN